LEVVFEEKNQHIGQVTILVLLQAGICVILFYRNLVIRMW